VAEVNFTYPKFSLLETCYFISTVPKSVLGIVFQSADKNMI